MLTDRTTAWIAALSLAGLGPACLGQVSVSSPVASPFAANVIVPQSASWRTAAGIARSSREGAVQITRVEVYVAIVEQVATTTMDVHLANPRPVREEAELLVPVPEDAAVRGLDFQGAGKEPSAQLLRKHEARTLYESLVSRTRDPALLEFIDCNLVRTSVFPVEAGGTQRVRLIYEHLLTADGPRVDYVLPRSDSLDYRVPWKIDVRISSTRPIATVYSPTHELQMVQKQPNTVAVRISDAAALNPGAFRLSYLLQHEEMTASLLTYPDAAIGGGYFLLLAGVPARPPTKATTPAIRREVTLVIDHSGSMAGEKIAQVQEAARQVIGGLRDGESFNLVAYSDSVRLFSPEPVLKTADSARKAIEYVRELRAAGGTNIHAALTEALRIKPMSDMLPLVLFLTDGQPTVGQTSEVAIREVAMKANPYHRRIFTFGVGMDVNTPLLERIAGETRAVPTFILPDENVEVKVATLFKRLTGPILAEPTLVAAAADGSSCVSDVIPALLPDLFEDDQLVVVGKYKDADQIRFELSGNYLGSRRSFAFSFPLRRSATVQNAFVPRLWASRRIAELVDAIRQLGADNRGVAALATMTNAMAVPSNPTASSDPRMKELVDEIVRLSLQFGILTEYTAFLAHEGTDLNDSASVVAQLNYNLSERAMKIRSGAAAVVQSLNNAGLAQSNTLNLRNAYLDDGMNRVTISNVQQMGTGAFYQRNGQWFDSRIADRTQEVAPARKVTFGSREYFELAEKLATENRQASLALRGDVLLMVDGQPVLIEGAKD
ncbi:MAG TPA: VIT and VWA domain-containing protein [Phycisphaerae bacterium]|nr:VIT and VWA domain-containing protein [Phycisphaerae bacterium]